MAATDGMDRNRTSYGKGLPPITLSNISIPGLVSLIPMLVAMTSRAQNPCFDNEQDKPTWWPDDIKWRNPTYYCSYMGDNILKLLRKVVRSCYSYHGVEDLLCRLDESALSEVVDISDDNDERESDASTSNDGPVFVCCFCLEEFSSHEQVSSHQRLCQEKSQAVKQRPKEGKTDVEKELEESLEREPTVKLCKTITVPIKRVPHPVSISTAQGFESDWLPDKPERKSVPERKVSKDTVKAVPKKVSNSSTASKRQVGAKFVPILKTRSQKKLDHIMDRHKKKQMMITECKNLIEVPRDGAWWTRRKRKKRGDDANTPSIHPSKHLGKHEFMSNVGLGLRMEKDAQQIEKDKKDVDLDCQIIDVEGPLSLIPAPPPLPPVVQDSSNSCFTMSPRGSKMSLLARDETNSRRRISFCFVEDEWADKEAIEEGRDPLHMSLLTLDLSSPLGQRIKKYVRSDGQMNVVKDVEVYCKTELKGENKLRVRASDFKVTHRKKCRASTYVHSYKFNRVQVREFLRHLKTGLSMRTQKLLSSMRKCGVRLKKWTEDDIRLFNEKKVTIAKNIAVDDDLCITQIDIPESRYKSHNNNRTPTPSLSSPFSSSSSASSVRPASLSAHSSQSRLHHHPSHTRPHHRRPPSHSLPHHFLHHRYPFCPRNSSMPARPHHHSPSPPHIPNIFRNRSGSNSPTSVKSPLPRDGVIKAIRSLIHQSGRPQNPAQLAKFKNALFDLRTQQRNAHLGGRPTPYPPPPARGATTSSSSHPPPAHTTQHSSSSKRLDDTTAEEDSQMLGFSSGVIITEQRRPGPATANRRKQEMNRLRHDDSSSSSASSLNKTATTLKLKDITKDSRNSKSFVNIAANVTTMQSSSTHSPSALASSSPSLSSLLSSSSSPSLSSLISSSSSSSSSFSRPSQQNLKSQERNIVGNSAHTPQDLSKLSNFEYFSIKQGKLLPGHSIPVHCNSSSPLIASPSSSNNTSSVSHRNPTARTQEVPPPPTVVKSPHLKPPVAANKTVLLPTPQPPPAHSHHNNSSSSSSTNSHANAMRQHRPNNVLPPSGRPNVIKHHQQQQKKIVSLLQPPQQQQQQQQQASSPHHQHLPPPSSIVRNKPAHRVASSIPVVDDDVMEVICIDD